MKRDFTQIISFAFGCVFAISQLPAADKKAPDFAKEILPILSDKCYACHGPDAKKKELRLDSYEAATQDLGGYKAIDPKNLDKSEIIARLFDQEDPMPPEKAEKQISAEDRDKLVAWVKSGGEYATHWAFLKPKHKGQETKIDDFVEKKLKENNLSFSKTADKATLARRASLVLTGLPPKPEELDAFIKNKSDTAYSDFVDQLLENPRYGEHQARYWLDAVRYGDTHGLHLDNRRGIYPYRDWVIQAFNQNMPLNTFITWQLAGDLMPNPSLEQLVATGFVRMNPSTAEGGVIPAEFQAKNNFDRVETLGTVFLGASLICARCHTHKYDPITHTEYYQLMAYFNSTAESPLDGNSYTYRPTIQAPKDIHTWKMWNAFEKKQKAFIQSIHNHLPKHQAKELNRRSTDQKLAYLTQAGLKWKPLRIESTDPKQKQAFDQLKDQSVALKTNGAHFPRLTFKTSVQGKVSSLRLDFIKDRRYKKHGPGHSRNGDFKLGHIKITVEDKQKKKKEVKIKSLQASHTYERYQLDDLLVDNNKVWGIYPRTGQNHYLILNLDKAIEASNDSILHITLTQPDKKFRLGRFKVSYSQSPLTKTNRDALQLYGELNNLKKHFTTTLVTKELDKPRKTFLLKRGEYSQPSGDPLMPGTLSVMGTSLKNAPKNRLGLAQWITSPEHPTVARVLVNRIWQRVFGDGLVRTPEDFGLQGEHPTHPELLDWLALQLHQQNWDLKKLLKLMVMSRTFQQSSKWRSDVNDPKNKLLARGPMFRLDAEVLRDIGLWAGDILDPHMGGEGVKPYQPKGLWSALMHPASNTKNYIQDKGSKIYRRSLYVYWKRTSPHPMLTLFDAPSRETSCVKRSRSNTPLQSLGLLNETQRVEMARKFAEKVMKLKQDPSERIHSIFKHIASREANPTELKACLTLFNQSKLRYTNSKQDAEDLLKIGELKNDSQLNAIELAAWTQVTSMVLASDLSIMLY